MDFQPDSPTVEELAMQSTFQQWVRQPTPMLDRFWEDWARQHPNREQLVAQARELVLSLDFADDLRPEEVDQEWQKMQQLIAQPARPEAEKQALPQRSVFRSWIARAAVLAGVILGAAGLYYQMQSDSLLTYESDYGQIKTVKLPDGSTVVLNAHSSIRLARNWPHGKPREVWVDGEAYFSVTHQPDHQRFLVHTPDSLTIEVLGTTFSVLHRQSQSRVVLNTGKIRLHRRRNGKTESLLMQPGDKVAVKKEKRTLEKQTVNPTLYTAFTQDKLVFQNTPLSEIIEQLSELYNMEIQLADSALLKKEFTGTFPVSKPSVVVNALTQAYNLHVIHQQNKLILEPRKDTSLIRMHM